MIDRLRIDQYFEIDIIAGQVEEVPYCKGCDSVLRPNIQMQHDLEWVERMTQQQADNFAQFIDQNKKRSKTIIEIGAGPSTPISREVAEMFLKNDKYRAALVRINPVRERMSQYEWEKEKFFELSKIDKN